MSTPGNGVIKFSVHRSRLHGRSTLGQLSTALLHNYKAVVTYDGTNYNGFQLQNTAKTIQGELEKALTKVLQSDREQLKLTGSGRTDAGVHARGQVRLLFPTHMMYLQFPSGCHATWCPDVLSNVGLLLSR